MISHNTLYYIFHVTWLFLDLYCDSCFLLFLNSNSIMDIVEFCIHLLFGGYLKFFLFGSITNKTAMTIYAHMSIKADLFISLGWWLWIRMAGTYDRCRLDYLRKCQLFSKITMPFCTPTTIYKSFSFPHLCQHLIWSVSLILAI